MKEYITRLKCPLVGRERSYNAIGLFQIIEVIGKTAALTPCYTPETLLGDNNQKVTIQVGYPAGIELLGRPLRERQPYSNDVKKGSSSPSTAKAIGPDVRHELEVSGGL